MVEKFWNKYRISSARMQNWDYGWNGAYFITICTKNRRHYFGEIINSEMHLNETGKLAEQYWLEIPIHFPFIELGNFQVMPNHFHGILIIDKMKYNGNVDVNVDVNDDGNVGGNDDGNDGGNDRDKAMPCLFADPIAADPIAADPIATNSADSATADPTTANPAIADPADPIAANPATADPADPIAADPIATNSADPNSIAPVPAPTNKTIGQLRFQNQGSGTISSVLGSYKSVVSKYAHRINKDFNWQSRFYDHIIRDAGSFERIQNYIENNPKNWKEDKFYE